MAVKGPAARTLRPRLTFSIPRMPTSCTSRCRGRKKEDVGVNWDADRSELNVAGVIYRPGDEEFLKTLALDERKVGVFERKVRLGSRQAPAAQVESEGISARMEDGILMITIPKVDKDFVEVRKVDIE